MSRKLLAIAVSLAIALVAACLLWIQPTTDPSPGVTKSSHGEDVHADPLGVAEVGRKLSPRHREETQDAELTMPRQGTPLQASHARGAAPALPVGIQNPIRHALPDAKDVGDKQLNAVVESVDDVLSDPTVNWQDPDQRAEAVARMKAAEDRALAQAQANAKKQGRPLRLQLPDGTDRELVGMDPDTGELLYYETKNRNAAISTAANLLQAAPYNLDGTGLLLGVWDSGSVRSTHQCFNQGPTSRVNVRDGASSSDHGTHVGGTMAAFGVQANAKGMANQAILESYDWTSDTSEMTAAGASGIGQFGSKIYLSNHSYGYSYGWQYDGGWVYSGTGSNQDAYDADYGKYSSTARNLDNVAFNSPYYLIFWAAGNENNDGPNNGNTVTINGTSDIVYDSSIHPPNDGDYRNGFETVGGHGVAKNLITIGAANDAVTSGQRDPLKATKIGFSCTGPVDDGRIKPDLMANGASLYSTRHSSDTAYGNKSGTSMASPNATGSAALLVELYRDLFGSSAAMRASTLKGLLIHTATDLGNPGPDYKNGWGLINVKGAADHIQRESDLPLLEGIVEDELSTSDSSQTVRFRWDGSSPIRATLCWTDPAGASESSHDNRTPDLVNDLNLKLIAPDGAEFFPFVMPFVGTWTVASMNENATTGVNNTDNVEMVHIPSPGQAGIWTAEITHTGSLTDGVQEFGLLVSGSTQGGPLVSTGTNVLDLTTIQGANVPTQSFTVQNGGDDTINYSITDDADWLSCTPTSGSSTGEADTIDVNFSTTSLSAGTYTATITIADPAAINSPATVAVTLEVLAGLPFTENFDSTDGTSLPEGWTEQVIGGDTNWKSQVGGRDGGSRPSTAQGGSGKNMTLFNASFATHTSRLITPVIDLNGYSNPYLSFWHTQEQWSNDQDELKIYTSTDGGQTWVEIAHYTDNLSSWTSRTINLPNGSESIRIAFEGIAKYGYGICLDTVSVMGDSIYQDWTAGVFENSFNLTGANSDPDGDGMLNFVEFAFGLDPTTTSTEPMIYVADGELTTPGLPLLENFGSGFEALFTRRKDHMAAGLTYVVEFSADLRSWTSSSAGLQVVTGSGSSGLYEAVSVPFPTTVPLQAGGFDVPNFFRVEVDME